MKSHGRSAFFLLATVFALGAAGSRAEDVTLKCTADTSICCHSSETGFNMGACQRIKAKGVENFLLFNFDAAPIKGRSVEKATLFLKAAIPKPMFRKAGVSTVSCSWIEGGRDKEEAARDGESTFLSPETGKRTWAGPGTDFTYASFGNGGTFWRRVYLEPPKEDWFQVPVDARIVEAIAQGLSFGLSLSDDNGEVMYISKDVCPDTCHDNNYFCSRETGADGPRMAVTLKAEADKAAPGAIKDLKIESWPADATFEKGAVRVTWVASGDDGDKGAALGYVVKTACAGAPAADVPRWQVPLPPKSGEPVIMILDELEPGAEVSLEIAAVDAGGNASPAAKASGKVSPARARPEALKLAGLRIGKGAEPPVRDGKMRVWAFGDCLKVNPVNGNLLEEKGVAYNGEPAGAYRNANAVWEGAAGLVPRRDGKGDVSGFQVFLSGARGEWVAFQLAIEAADAANPKLSGVKVKLADFDGPAETKSKLGMKDSLISRAWYVKVKDAWYADPLAPVAGGFDIPWAENNVPGHRNQTVYVEFFVPKDARPGSYAGSVAISAEGVKEFALPIWLDVLPFAIPDDAHFVWSMNAYGSPGRPWGGPKDAKYLATERDFYVASHAHRTCFAALHYGHGGKIYDEAAPPVEGKGAAARVSDWSQFDARFGPLFDASAFAGTARAGVPLDHFYLAFHENWPVTMAEGYKWNVDKFEDHWKVCGPVEDGFSQEYKDAWKAVLADFAKHIQAKGWGRTRFQVYLNNKFFYKMYDEKKKKRGTGTSFWLLDEPHYADDFRAVGFFGGLVRGALGGKSGAIVHRGDISRPQWQRDCLDGLMDLTVSGNYAGYRRKMEERREKHAETIWTYGGLCGLDASVLDLEARALQLYGQTVDGFVPWLTLGTESSWKEPTDTAAFYPGKPVGVDGCVPSLKLKACRRGEQDVEYLWLLAQKRGLDRKQAAALVEGGLKLSSTVQRLDEHGTTYQKFEGVTYEAFDVLRRAAAEALGGGQK